MSAPRYYRRLRRARIWWCAFIAAIWLIYIAGAGITPSLKNVTIVLGVVWFLGYPRNWARFMAKRARSANDFSDAVDREARRR